MPRIDDPGYVPALEALCEEFGVGAVVPLTDLDLEVLGHARVAGRLPAFVPDPEFARATFDKYEAHLLLERLGLPSPPTVLPGRAGRELPGDGQAAPGLGRALDHRADDARAADFFVDYVKEPTMIQRAMDGPEFSIDCLSDLDGRCLNAIPRSMIESRGGESIKGTVIDDGELVELGRRVVDALGCRGPCTVQVFRDREIGLGITDVNTRFGGAFPAPMYAALPGRTYPELIVRMARGRADRATRRRVHGRRHVHALLLAAGARRGPAARPGATSSIRPGRRARGERGLDFVGAMAPTKSQACYAAMCGARSERSAALSRSLAVLSWCQ